MGKTTTKDILAAIALPQRRTVAAERSFNNELGVPLTVCRIEPDTELAILELSMRGLGQIASLAAYTRPHVGVITTIAPVHLEPLGSLENIVRAKGELLEALPAGGTAVVPAGFEVARDDLEVVRVGEDVTLESFEPPHLRTSLGELEVSFTARHLATNALTALATARALGLDLPAAARGRVLRLAEPGARASGRRPAAQRRLEREPALDAGRARAPELARGGPAPCRRPRRDGRARRLLGRGPRGGRARDPGDRRRAADLGRAASRRLRRAPRRDADEAIAAVRDRLEPGDVVLVKGARALGLERVAEALTTVSA